MQDDYQHAEKRFEFLKRHSGKEESCVPQTIGFVNVLLAFSGNMNCAKLFKMVDQIVPHQLKYLDHGLLLLGLVMKMLLWEFKLMVHYGHGGRYNIYT